MVVVVGAGGLACVRACVRACEGSAGVGMGRHIYSPLSAGGPVRGGGGGGRWGSAVVELVASRDLVAHWTKQC